MAAPTQNDVNASKAFKSTALIDRPVQTFKASPRITPNPFTGLPQTNAYAKAHHLVDAAPDTVLEATRTNPVD